MKIFSIFKNIISKLNLAFKYYRCQDIGITDANALTENGFYSGLNLTNAPSSSTYHNYVVTRTDNNANYVTQLAFPQDQRHIFMRYKYAGTWTAWGRYTTDKFSPVQTFVANSSSPVTISLNGTFNLFILVGFFQGIGNLSLLVSSQSNDSVTVNNLLTGATYSSQYLTITRSGTTFTIQTYSTSNSLFTVLMGGQNWT